MIERITTPRTLLARERGEMAAFLADHDVPGEAATELLDHAELHGDAISLRWGAELFVTSTSWGGDVFAPVRPGESADGEAA